MHPVFGRGVFLLLNKNLVPENKKGYTVAMKSDHIIDIRTITSAGPSIHFVATPAECESLAKRFELPQLHDFRVEGCFSRDDMISFSGQMTALADRICGVTLEKFPEKTETPIRLLFTESDLGDNEPMDADVFPVTKGKIDLFEAFAEVLGLSLNPFPKKTSGYLDYTDPNDCGRETPFAALEKLKKKG